MKNGFVAIFYFVLLCLLPLPEPVVADNSAQVRKNVARLLQTKQCQGCYLVGAKLNRMDLRRVNLAGANLTRAELYLTDLSRANLKQARLRGARLGGADLSQANLVGADLTGAMVAGVYWEGANTNGMIEAGAPTTVAQPVLQDPPLKIPERKVLVPRVVVAGKAPVPYQPAVVVPKKIPELPGPPLSRPPKKKVEKVAPPLPMDELTSQSFMNRLALGQISIRDGMIIKEARALPHGRDTKKRRPVQLPGGEKGGRTTLPEGAAKAVAPAATVVIPPAVQAELVAAPEPVPVVPPVDEAESVTAERSGLGAISDSIMGFFSGQSTPEAAGGMAMGGTTGVSVGGMFSGGLAAGEEAPALSAAQQQVLDKLLETKRCVGCELAHASLVGAELAEADLERIDLNHADLRDIVLEKAKPIPTAIKEAIKQPRNSWR